MRWHLSLIIFLFCGTSSLVAANTVVEDLILSSFVVPERAEKSVMNVATEFEIVGKRDNGLEVYVPQDKVERFLRMAPEAQLIQRDIGEDLKRLKKNNPEWLADYRSFSEITAYISQIAEDYPDIARLESYGQSLYGRPLYALKISDRVAQDEDEPELMLTAATHGDELIAPEVLLGLLQEIVEGYGKDKRLTSMVENTEIFFLPVVNPDGFSRQSRYAHGIDPNRDYPWPENEVRDPVQCIAKEISFFEDHDIAGSMDFHAYGQMVMFPWAYTYGSPLDADNRVFSDLVNYLAEENNYRAGQISKVIYVAKGSSADYYYWKNGTTALAIEVATTKVPHSSRIPRVVDEAREMTWRFIESFVD